MLCDGLEGPGEAEERGGRLTTLTLPQMGQDPLEGVELHETGEGGHLLDRGAGQDQGRCGLEDLMAMQRQGCRAKSPNPAFLGFWIHTGQASLPLVHVLP